VSFTPLGYSDLGLAAILIAVNAGLFIWLRLRLERQLVIATLRMLVQLSLLGLVLKTLFEHVSPIYTGLAALAMILFAGYEVFSRQQRRLAGWWGYGVGAASILFAGTLVTVFALTTQVRPEPWYHPQIALPLLGMVLGNTMTGVALGLDTLSTRVARERTAIEAMLSLGATRQEAFRPFVREAMRNALIPIINAMSAAGLVSIPGMMTGQILAGIDPIEAVKYQILIMFLIAGGTGIGVVLAVHVTAARLSDGRHRLRLDRLKMK